MLISAILQECIDESIIDLSTTSMLTYMKAALRQIATILKYRGFLTEGTLSVAAAAQSASLSSLTSGFLKERAVWFVSDGQRVPIHPPPSEKYFWNVYNTNGSGKPNYYLIEGTTIKFDQPLDAAVTIGIDFFKEISSVALSDTFLGDERVIQAAKHLTKAEYFYEYEEDEKKGGRNKQDGLGLLVKIGQDYEEAQMSGNVEIKDYDGV